MGLFSWLFGGSRQTPRVTVTVDVRHDREVGFDPYSDYPLHVVGESYRQADLQAIAEDSGLDDGRARLEDSAECRVTAVLVFEDDNAHDNQAVKVMVLDRHVGYLSRADARRYRQMQDAPATVPALIVGGWDRGARGSGYYGVRLALSLDESSR